VIQDLKSLVVIIFITLPIWLLAPSIFGKFSSTATVKARRNTWIILTILGLISPTIWIYLFIAFPLVYRAARLDPNPAALFILLFFAVPNAQVSIPGLPFEVFPVGHRRMLALAFIAPIFLTKVPSKLGAKKIFDLMFLILLAFVFLKFSLDAPYRSETHSLRELILLFLDAVLIYFIFRIFCDKPEQILDCLSMWVLVAILLSAVAIFEHAKGWLLYTSINARWGDENVFSFLVRAGSLRAQASTGHSLALGLWLAIAWPFFLVIQQNQEKFSLKLVSGVLILLGLWSSGSRGPWLATLVSTIVYFGMNPIGASQGIKYIIKMIIIIGAILISPIGQSLIPYLPFVGTIDPENIDYRIHLFEVCVNLIKSNPFFGNPFALNQMESLRQGQGIIDLVNGYLLIAVFNGLISLGLFLALLVVGVRRTVVAWHKLRINDLRCGYIGAALVGAMIGNMLFIATAGIDPETYMLAGMMCGYWWMHRDSNLGPK
jgi:O-antigen ligase